MKRKKKELSKELTLETIDDVTLIDLDQTGVLSISDFPDFSEHFRDPNTIFEEFTEDFEDLDHYIKRKNRGRLSDKQRKLVAILMVLLSIEAIGCLIFFGYSYIKNLNHYHIEIAELQNLKEEATSSLSINSLSDNTVANDKGLYASNGVLWEYASLYERNHDFIGWLTIEDTIIDYPVMQTPEDENFYLKRDFDGNDNKNGTLLVAANSTVGTGSKANNYLGGTKPSTNIIIHGHNMMSGEQFGGLKRYQDEEYGKAHSIIHFDSLQEKRTYILVACFFTKVYNQKDVAFKYYKFHNAYTALAFEDFYSNIKRLALYDTGVTASYGDEFLTLSTCAYHVKNGRFVVVAKRIE